MELSLIAIYVCMALSIVASAWLLQPGIRAAVNQMMDSLQQASLDALPVRFAPRRRNPFLGVFRRIGAALPYTKQEEPMRGARVHSTTDLIYEEFRGLKVVCAIALAFAYTTIAMEFRAIHPLGCAAALAAGFFIPQLWLRSRNRARDRRILRLLPEVIDLLALCVGAGVDFLGALNRIVAAREYRNEPLIDELSLAIQEMKLGKRKVDALKAMSARVKLPELASFVRALAQADRMGTPIADVLAVHAEDVRTQRFTRAERLALQAPLKLLVPLIFCIMPCVAIIVAAPIFIQFARYNPFAGLGQ